MDPDRLMRNMLQSMGMPMGMGMSMSPFGGGMFGDPFNIGGQPGPHQNDPISAMMPHGPFMSPMSMMMMNPFQGVQQAMTMANNSGNGGFSYCSSSVTSYTTDEQGRPQVYQQSNEVKSAPGGVKETRSALRDSRTGRQEMSIGRHLKDKAHINKKLKNVYTGEEEHHEDLINIEESEAETFNQNWEQQARNFTSSSQNQLQYGQQYGRPSSRNNNRLAITSSAEADGGDQPQTSRKKSHFPATSYVDKLLQKTKKKKKSKEART